MQPTYFEGVAGSGKTFHLIATLAERIDAAPLGDGQKVLALSFMHGSRRRLQARLENVPKLLRRFTCCTFDRFAWQLIHRWTSLLKKSGAVLPGGAADYDATCAMAAELLGRDEVRGWVARTYPIVLVDEMQDVRDGRLTIVQELARSAAVIAAADEFQDLNGDDAQNEAVEWLRANGIANPLTTIHRTSSRALIEGANAIRSGSDTASKGDFRCEPVPNHHLAATYVAGQLATHGSRDVALLTPARDAAFVTETINKLSTTAVAVKWLGTSVGPLTIAWEGKQSDEESQIATIIGLPSDESAVINLGELRLDGEANGLRLLAEILERHRKLTGVHGRTVGEIRKEIKKVIHARRAFGASRENNLRAMTIQQAKNREFRGVIVFWPYQVSGATERQRRLLYNAVTRAKEWALVLVQDPNKIRIASPPFTREAPSNVATSTARQARPRKK